MNILVYDVEVLRGPNEVENGWNDPEAMGFGTAVVWNYKHNQYFFFDQTQKEELALSLAGGLVISFNGIKFDNRVVLGNDYQNGEKCWTDLDLLLEVIKSKFSLNSVKEAEEKLGAKEIHDGSIGLDGLAQGTLGMYKTGHGSYAPKLIRQNRWAEVYAYNLHDVRLTRMLYEFGLKYGYLIDKNGIKIPVNFKQETVAHQLTPIGS